MKVNIRKMESLVRKAMRVPDWELSRVLFAKSSWTIADASDYLVEQGHEKFAISGLEKHLVYQLEGFEGLEKLHGTEKAFELTDGITAIGATYQKPGVAKTWLEPSVEDLTVSTLVFDKEKFTEKAAIAWANKNKYTAEKMLVKKSSLQISQAQSEEFVPGSFRPVALADGVSAVSGVKSTDVVKFAEGDDRTAQPPQDENKEVFDGTKYVNVAPGEKTMMTEVSKGQEQVERWGKMVPIAKRMLEKRVVIGAVYVPYDENDPTTVDTHGHACSSEDIEKAAYGFMESLNNRKIDKQHNYVPGYGCVVESYIAKAGDPLFSEGTWVMGVRVTNDTAWQQILDGDITGFSLAGDAILDDSASIA